MCYEYASMCMAVMKCVFSLPGSGLLAPSSSATLLASTTIPSSSSQPHPAPLTSHSLPKLTTHTTSRQTLNTNTTRSTSNNPSLVHPLKMEGVGEGGRQGQRNENSGEIEAANTHSSKQDEEEVSLSSLPLSLTGASR